MVSKMTHSKMRNPPSESRAPQVKLENNSSQAGKHLIQSFTDCWRWRSSD